MEQIRYIKDRWLNKKYERIAIRHQGNWIYYKIEKNV